MTDLHQDFLSEVMGPMSAMSNVEVKLYLQQLYHWQLQGSGIARVLCFSDYPSCLEFSHQLGLLAESVNHHPRITVTWRQVLVEWWTHSLGGLHKNDFIMAAKTDKLALSYNCEN